MSDKSKVWEFYDSNNEEWKKVSFPSSVTLDYCKSYMVKFLKSNGIGLSTIEIRNHLDSMQWRAI